MMRTALFVAALMAHGATASDQSRVAVELDEDLTPEEQIPGVQVPLPANAVDLFTAAFGAAVAQTLFGTEAAEVSVALLDAGFVAAGYTPGTIKQGVNIAGILQITFTVTASPTTAAVPGNNDVTVTLELEMDRSVVEANPGGAKQALAVTIAKDLNINYDQISNVKLTFVNAAGDTVTVRRHAEGLSTGGVTVEFSVCANLGCLGSYSVGPVQYTANQLTNSAFDRPATAITFATITTQFPVGYTLTDNTVGAAISATVATAPQEKADATSSIVFYMGMNIDWALISANSGMYKKAWQFAVANRLVVNPFQVNDIGFVRMSTTTTVGRHATAQAIERVNAHQTVCQTKCAPNTGVAGTPGTPGATLPPAFPEDDDSSIIAVAVIVPITVIAIVLVIVWYLVCGGDEEKKEPAVPYGGDQEQAAGPDQTDEPVPAGEDERV